MTTGGCLAKMGLPQGSTDRYRGMDSRLIYVRLMFLLCSEAVCSGAPTPATGFAEVFSAKRRVATKPGSTKEAVRGCRAAAADPMVGALRIFSRGRRGRSQAPVFPAPLFEGRLLDHDSDAPRAAAARGCILTASLPADARRREAIQEGWRHSTSAPWLRHVPARIRALR
jgi:hypothetical protein